jgi:hypothetical protein
MTRRPAAIAGAAVLALVLSACGSDGGGGTADPKNPYLPTGSPSVSVTLMDPPADYSTITGKGFSISAPGEFQQQHLTSSNGEPMLVLEKPSSVEAVPQRVAVIRDVDPKQSAAEQSFALETAKAAAGPAGEAERSEIDVPGDGSAFLITWKESRPSKGAADVEVTYWQLMQQVDDALILNVVAFAPTDEFETSEVSKILRTFVADDSDSA